MDCSGRWVDWADRLYAALFLTRERIASTEKAQAKYEFKTALKAFMKNRPAIGMCLASFAQLACFMTIMTMFQYVFQVYFKNTDMIILGSVITSLPMVLLIPFVSKLTKRFGKRRCPSGR